MTKPVTRAATKSEPEIATTRVRREPWRGAEVAGDTVLSMFLPLTVRNTGHKAALAAEKTDEFQIKFY
jgi:hypothetical protein